MFVNVFECDSIVISPETVKRGVKVVRQWGGEVAKMEARKLTSCKTIKKLLWILLKKLNLNMGKRAMIWTAEQEFIVKGVCQRYCYITTHFAQCTLEKSCSFIRTCFSVWTFQLRLKCQLMMSKYINDRSVKHCCDGMRSPRECIFDFL